MQEQFGIIFDLGTIATIGLVIVIAFLGSKLFQRFGIPQVVGFIVIGALMGTSFLNIVPLELTEELVFISQIALGLIGYDIGSHLLLSDLRRLGRSILFILVFESIGAFVLVSGVVYLLLNDWLTAIMLGAVSAATAPAATVDVLAEYDTKGPLTTSILAVVGMDDAMALILFSISAAVVESYLTQTQAVPIWEIMGLPFTEIGGSLLMGFCFGMVLDVILLRMKRRHDAMAVSIGFIFLCVGLSEVLGFSYILTSMIMGMVVANRHMQNNLFIRHTIEQAGPVVYVLFFALVGARFQISLLPTMGVLGLVYLAARTIGKISGSFVGGVLGGADRVVRNYLGLGLMSQAGVAVGLALASYSRFCECGDRGIELGTLIITVITTTTFITQIIGPICVKFAVGRAGEIGMAKFEEDAWASEGTVE